MSNLFYREKENWFAWTLWGLIGATIGVFTANHSAEFWSFGIAIFALLVLLTWWMHDTRRFSYSRAFKVLFYVANLATLPTIGYVMLQNNSINHLDLAFQLVIGFMAALFVAVVNSFIARTPRQYY